MRAFSKKLIDLRAQYGYSQEALAEKLHVSRQAISKWELGITLPEIENVLVISEFFDVSIDYLLKDDIQFDSHDNLDRVIIKFLASAQDMDKISKELIEITRDGIIDEQERGRLDNIVDTLDKISAIIDEIKSKMNVK